jgi:transposase
LRAASVALGDENARLRTQVSEVPRLQARVEELAAQVQALQARLAKDSHNSSKPPSSDGLKRKTRSLRQKSGKKPGGQLGHRGATLHLVGRPDEVVEHRPTVCAACQTALGEAASVVLYERRQVQELPPVRLRVTEHRALHVRCPTCERVSIGSFPAEVSSRAQYGPRVRALSVYLVEQQHLPLGRTQQLLADLWGMRLARGTLVGWIQQAARVLEPVERQIKAALSRAPVLHHDETGVRRAGMLAWAHVTSTSRLTHYAIHTKRGHEAMDAIGILPTYRGVSVHDGWDSYGVYTACRHALCNVHHLRELTFLEEQYQQGWASDMKALLREMKAATEQARTLGHRHLLPAVRADFIDRYQALLKTGLAANPPPPGQERRVGQRGRLAQSPARNLLERLLLQHDEVLGISAFLDDLAIPFDNNQAERDLRGLKIQQKVSGCFRSEWGADAYATIRGYLATLRKQGQALLAALHTAFVGQPLAPALA